MGRGMIGIVVAGLAMSGVCAPPALAWSPSSEWGYQAVKECPNAENLCLVVSCPAKGAASLELMMFEHGRGTGEEIVLRIDGKDHPLALPVEGENALYRWPLSPEIAEGLRSGRKAGIVVDPGAEAHPVSLRGSGKAIGRVLASCGAAGSTAIPAASKTGGKAPLTGLSDDEGCAEARSEGVVVSRTMAGSKAIEGFRFKDRQYGESYINVSLPEAMSRARKAEIQARLLEVVTPGARLRMKVQGCGAGARIEVVSEIAPL